MRLGLLVVVVAAWLTAPLAALAQVGDPGPDASMTAATKADSRASPPTIKPPAAPGSEDAHADADCPTQPGGDKGADARAEKARCRKLTDADIATAPIAEVRQASRHQALIGGKQIAYTATAGTLTLRSDEGAPVASMFYVAYTTGDPGRPVTFLYNGGPGSSTGWLHMGSLGPVRVLT